MQFWVTKCHTRKGSIKPLAFLILQLSILLNEIIFHLSHSAKKKAASILTNVVVPMFSSQDNEPLYGGINKQCGQ